MKYLISLLLIVIAIESCRLERTGSAHNYFGNQIIQPYPYGVSRVDDINLLKQNLSNEYWGEVKKTYFGENYDPKLADLICYIKSNDSVRIGMSSKKPYPLLSRINPFRL